MTKPSAGVIATGALTGALTLFASVGSASGPTAAAASSIPAHCVEHVPLGGEDDFAGDYHCAGIALDYHLDGVTRSTGKIWAGQWLFADQNGERRLGLCTFNRGGHPRADIPSAIVTQTFPNDPSGTRRAYLAWRYGSTTDDLTAAALWALAHFYAADAAGSNRSSRGEDPLVPSLDVIAESSGRQDIEDLAQALHEEAGRFGQPFTIDVVFTDATNGRVTVVAGEVPVADTVVELVVSGATFADGSTTAHVTTDAGGTATFVVAPHGENVSVAASSTAPGATEVYRGVAADPSGVQPQTLLTAGVDLQITDTAAAPPSPTTTTTTMPEATTTTVPAATTTTAVAETTTTIAETTTTTTTTTLAETTTSEAPTTLVEDTTTFPTVPFVPLDVELPVASPPVVVSLPRTGSSDTAAYLGTALLVGGVGVIGAVRRNRLLGPSGSDSADGTADQQVEDSLGFW